MGFSVNVLTAPGQAILAAASSANRVIYTRVVTSTEAMTEQEAAAAQPSDFTGPQGSIVAASAVDNVARIVGSVVNQGAQAISLKSFALCAKLEQDVNDVVVMVLSDAAAAIELPAHEGPDAAAVIGFSIEIDAGEAGMVSVTSTASATIADLERFVSAHKAGDAYAGDNQAIYGEKVFLDNVAMTKLLAPDLRHIDNPSESVVRSYGFSDEDTGVSGVRIGYNYAGTGDAPDDINDWPAYIQVQSNGKPGIYVPHANHSVVAALHDDNDVENCLVSIVDIDGVPTATLSASDSANNRSAGIIAGASEVRVQANCKRGATNIRGTIRAKALDVTHGGATKACAEVYLHADLFDTSAHVSIITGSNGLGKVELVCGETIATLTAQKFDLYTDGAFYLAASYVEITGPTVFNNQITLAEIVGTESTDPDHLGDKLLTLDVDALTVNGDILPGDEGIDIGKSNSKFNAVYAESLNGLIPTTSSLTTPSVGSIFLAYIYARLTTLPARSIGYDLTPDPTPMGQTMTGDYRLWVAQMSLSQQGEVSVAQADLQSPVTAGTYRLLNAIPASSASDFYFVALVMRVS